MTGVLMRNKYKASLLLVAVLLLIFPLESYSEEKSNDSTRFSDGVIGISGAMNSKYIYPVVGIRYYTDRFIWDDKFRLRFDYEGYRITKYILPEYQRLLWQTDYKIELEKKGDYQHWLLPKVGFALIFDVYDEGTPYLWFSYSPNIGLDYIAKYKDFHFLASNTISFFSDGLWYEFKPEISYNIYGHFHLSASINIIFANTYNGNSDIGLFPGLSILLQDF